MNRTSLWLLACCLGILGSFSPAFAQRGEGSAPPRNLKSVEVAPDRSVTFRIHAPKAVAITVAGDFGRGTLEKDDRGVWSVTIDPLTPDFYAYSFNIDGVKTVDARNPLFKPGIAGLDSMFEVPGPESDFQATKDVPHGEIRMAWFSSNVLD